MRSGRSNQRNNPYNRGGGHGHNQGQGNSGAQGVQQAMTVYPPGGGQPYVIGAKPRAEEISTTLYVYNIGPQCQEQTLHNLFSNCGTVTKVAVIRDPVRGCTKGYAFVTFESYNDAASAVTSLNGYTLWEKPLQVMFKQAKGQQGGGMQGMQQGGMQGLQGGLQGLQQGGMQALQGLQQGGLQALQNLQQGGMLQQGLMQQQGLMSQQGMLQQGGLMQQQGLMQQSGMMQQGGGQQLLY